MKTLTVRLLENKIEVECADLTLIEIMGVANHLKVFAEVQDVAAIRADFDQRAEAMQAAKAD